MSAPHLRTGRLAEDFALSWLESHGLRHICSNYRCRFGELDLVMLDKDCLVIVEVRYRRNSSYGGALVSVTTPKQMRIARSTDCFRQQHRQFRDNSLRFDVLALSGPSAEPVVDWRKCAFTIDAN